MVEPGIEKAWLAWMNETHIPLVMASGCFLRYQFVRILDDPGSQGPTYALQLFATDRSACDHYSRLFDETNQKESLRLWGDQSLSFGTLMEVMH